MSAFRPLAVLRALHDAGVRFVVVGGVAARVHGSPLPTDDTDVCHDPSPDNVARLPAALAALDARPRGGHPAPGVAALRSADRLPFDTAFGPLDLIARPPGTAGYAELDAGAETVVLDGCTVRVAAVDDLLRMARAAGDPRRRAAGEVLIALRDEITERS